MPENPRKLIVAIDWLGTLSTMQPAETIALFSGIRQSLGNVPHHLFIATANLADMSADPQEFFDTLPGLEAIFHIDQRDGLDLDWSFIKGFANSDEVTQENMRAKFGDQGNPPGIIVIDDSRESGINKGSYLTTLLSDTNSGFNPEKGLLWFRRQENQVILHAVIDRARGMGLPVA